MKYKINFISNEVVYLFVIMKYYYNNNKINNFSLYLILIQWIKDKVFISYIWDQVLWLKIKDFLIMIQWY